MPGVWLVGLFHQVVQIDTAAYHWRSNENWWQSQSTSPWSWLRSAAGVILQDHSTKSLTSALSSSSCPPIIYPTAAVIRELLQVGRLRLVLKICGVQGWNGDRTVPLRCFQISHPHIKQSSAKTDKLWPVCQVVSNPGDHGSVNHHHRFSLCSQDHPDVSEPSAAGRCQVYSIK